MKVALCALAVLASTVSPVHAADGGEQDLAIELKGNLPPRCTSEITTGSPAPGPHLVLTILVRHNCNTDSNLVLRIAPVETLVVTPFYATYLGEQESAQSQNEVRFFVPGPINATSALVLTIPGMAPSEAAAVLATISIDVSPL